MNKFTDAQSHLRDHSYHWLVTGAAGFIGSNLVETLLKLGQRVTGLDNFATGHQRNLDEVRELVGADAWSRFAFIRADIRQLADCQAACQGVDYVLHQAALGSVSRSIADPITTNETNVTGFLNMLTAARDAKTRRFVYAASSSTYGDHPALPKVEAQIGNPLSPYAVTKYVNELYADVFARCYGTEAIGLRYFNVFGPRQNPDGPYASVIPAWIGALLRNRSAYVNGDGSAARDFCHVDNVVQANLLSAMTDNPGALDQAYNVAHGEMTSLADLFEIIRALLAKRHPHLRTVRAVHRAPRLGDIQLSRADTGKAARLLGYAPTKGVMDGLESTMDWYMANLSPAEEERKVANV